jgi:hypothetical protein
VIAVFLIGLLGTIVSSVIAAKIVLLIAMVLVYYGTWNLLKLITSNDSILFPFIAASSCINLFFYFGFANYYLGLGIALNAILYILKKREHLNLLVLTLLLTLCYLSHFTSLIMAVMPLLLILNQSRSSMLFKKICMAVTPITVLFIHYVFFKELTVAAPTGILKEVDYATYLYKIIIYLPASIKPIHRVKHVFEPAILFQILNYAFSALFFFGIGIVMVYYKTTILKNIYVQLILSYLLLAVFSPPYLAGILYIGERFVPLLWIVSIGCLFSVHRIVRSRIFLLLVCIGTAVSFTTLMYSTYSFNKQENILERSVILGVEDSLGGTNPFTHFHFYNDIKLHKAVPTFHTGIIRYKGANNSRPF